MRHFWSAQFYRAGSKWFRIPSRKTAHLVDNSTTPEAAWRSRPIRLIIIGGTVLIAVIIAATWLLLANLHSKQITKNERELESRAFLLAAQIDRNFQSIESIQQAVIERVQSLGIASAEDLVRQMSDFDTHQRFKDRISALPFIDALVLTDPDGKLINFSRFWPLPSVKVPTEDPAQVFKSHPHLTFLLGKPLLGPVTGTWVIPIARKITGPNSEFLGVITGVIQLQYFEQLFETVASKQDYAISLFSRDGILLARHPQDKSLLHKSFLDRAIFRDVLSKSDYGTVRQIGILNHEELLISGRNLGHYPMAVVITKTVNNALAGWRNEADYVTRVAMIIMFVIGGIVFLSAQQV